MNSRKRISCVLLVLFFFKLFSRKVSEILKACVGTLGTDIIFEPSACENAMTSKYNVFLNVSKITERYSINAKFFI